MPAYRSPGLIRSDMQDILELLEEFRMSELKECPFCGSQEPMLTEHPPHKHVFINFPDHPGSWTIECSCGVGVIDSTRESVISRWNQRTLMGGGEAVEYQFRTKPEWNKSCAWTQWVKCTKEQYDDYVRVPLLHDWRYEARILYTHPTPDESVLRDAERYRWLRDNKHVTLVTGFFGNCCINKSMDDVNEDIDAAMKES